MPTPTISTGPNIVQHWQSVESCPAELVAIIDLLFSHVQVFHKDPLSTIDAVLIGADQLRPEAKVEAILLASSTLRFAVEVCKRYIVQ